jgi:hypothetical protein
MSSYLQSLSDNAVQKVLDALIKDNHDVVEYLKRITENNIKNKVKEIVSTIIMDKTGKNNQDILLKEFASFVDVSIYLAHLVLSSFCFNIETDVKAVKGFDYSNYLAFVFFLLDYANVEEINFDKNKDLFKIVQEEEDFLSQEDFFDSVEKRAKEIFDHNKNDNYSSAFALKDFVQTELKDRIKIKWHNEVNESAHCKPLSIEKLFYI